MQKAAYRKSFYGVWGICIYSRWETLLAWITWYERPQVDRDFCMWKQDYENDVINTQFGETKEEFLLCIWSLFVCFWRDSPQWARASSFTRILDHIQRSTTVGRTPLDEWPTRRRDLCLTSHNPHNIKTSMTSRIRTQNLSRRAATDLRLRPRGHWDRLFEESRFEEPLKVYVIKLT